MFDIVLSNQFKKDLKLIVKRGYKLEKLNKVVDKLASNIELEDKHRDHSLTGNYTGFREGSAKREDLNKGRKRKRRFKRRVKKFS